MVDPELLLEEAALLDELELLLDEAALFEELPLDELDDAAVAEEELVTVPEPPVALDPPVPPELAVDVEAPPVEVVACVEVLPVDPLVLALAPPVACPELDAPLSKELVDAVEWPLPQPGATDRPKPVARMGRTA